MDVIHSIGDQSFGLSHPSSALHASQQAPAFLQNSFSSWAPLTAAESSDQWATYEYLLLVCLRTGDDKSAHLCLNRLTERFGPANERIMGLRGLYQEAIAKDTSTLQGILQEYDNILQESAVNVPILKRRAALLRSLGRDDEAISALVDYVEAFPTDAEAWCELADCYQANAMSAQAIFSVEEALLVIPNSWNLHARLGELLYISTTSTTVDASSAQILARSMRHFLRSLELCDSFARALYGLILVIRPTGLPSQPNFAQDAMRRLSSTCADNFATGRQVTSKLLKHPEYLSGNSTSGTKVPSKEIVEEVSSMALHKSEELVRSQQSQPTPHGAQGDLLALKELVQQK